MALSAFLLIARDATRHAGRTFDLAGALTGTAATTLVVIAIVQGPESGWTTPAVIASSIAGTALLAAFLVIQRRSRDPLLPLRLLSNRDLRTGVIVTFLYMATFGSLLYFLTGLLPERARVQRPADRARIPRPDDRHCRRRAGRRPARHRVRHPNLNGDQPVDRRRGRP